MSFTKKQKSFIEINKKRFILNQNDEQSSYEGGHENQIFEHWVLTKNPLLIWHELKYRLKNNLEIPDWVNKYFLKCAENITKIKTEKTDKAESLVYQALEFSYKGNGTWFSSYHKMNQKMLAWALVEDYLYEFKGSGKDSSKEKAFLVVSEIFNLEEGTIKKWYLAEKENIFFDPKKIHSNNPAS